MVSECSQTARDKEPSVGRKKLVQLRLTADRCIPRAILFQKFFFRANHPELPFWDRTNVQE